jgi:hypothetical protein
MRNSDVETVDLLVVGGGKPGSSAKTLRQRASAVRREQANGDVVVTFDNGRRSPERSF